MKDYIKKRLSEDLEYWHVDDASPESLEYKMQSENVFMSGEGDKWSALERDVADALMPLVEKHKDNFGFDSYAVIDAIQQVFDGMFEKVSR